MNHKNPFKWRHYAAEIILTCVRWYSRYCLSYRDLEEMMNERGLNVDHTTIYRWVQRYANEIKKRMKLHLKNRNNSWRIDETYLKIKGKWHYLYRAVDSEGKTLDFYLSETRDAKAAEIFFKKLGKLGDPRALNVDKNPAYPPAFDEVKKEGIFKKTEFRRVKYLNNILEQDHRTIKRQHRHAKGYQSMETASNTIDGIESLHMAFKNQVESLPDTDALDIKKFIEILFEIGNLAA